MNLYKLKTVIYNFIVDIKNFSFDVAIAHAPYLLHSNVEDMNQKSNSVIYRTAYIKRENSIQRYLKHYFKDLIAEYKEKQNSWNMLSADEKAPIWILWWQGMDNAPEIIKLCTKSKIKYADRREVIVVTQQNYNQYIDIPQEILDKVAIGKISITHLSDIIRVSILAEHGGLWLDASIFCVGEFPEYVLHSYFFTCKCNDSDIENISKNRWTTYALGGAAHNLIFSFIRDAFFLYCQEHTRFIDYFMFDHIIAIAYDELEKVRELIDCVPENNANKEGLSQIMNEVFDEKQFTDLKNRDTFLCKIAWKREFKLHTEDGKQTYYGHLKKEIEG